MTDETKCQQCGRTMVDLVSPDGFAGSTCRWCEAKEEDALRSRLAEAEKRAEKAEADCRDHESARATQAQAMVETGRFLDGVEQERDAALADNVALAAAVGEIGEFAERYAKPLVDGLRQLGEAGAVAELLDSAVDSVLELAAQVKGLASSHSGGPLARYRAKVLEEVRQLFQEVVARDGTTAMFDAELGRMAGEAGEWSRDIGPDGEQIRYDGEAGK